MPKKVLTAFNKALLEEIDAVAAEQRITRSALLRQYVIDGLKRDRKEREEAEIRQIQLAQLKQAERQFEGEVA